MSTSNSLPIYESAFNTTMLSVWQNTKFRENISQMSYYRSICAYIRSGIQGDAQRRLMMYYWLISIGYPSDLLTDVVNKYYSGLPTSNLQFKRILNNLAQVYNDPPTRKINTEGVESDNDVKAEILAMLLTESGFDNAMQRLHKIAKASGKAVARPRIKQGKMNYQILMPDQYQTDKDEAGNILAIWIPYTTVITNPTTGEQEAALRFEYWDSTDYKVLDSEGNATEFPLEIQTYDANYGIVKTTSTSVTSWAHNYGRVPYAELTFSLDDIDISDNDVDMYELVKEQLNINYMDLLSNENLTLSAFSMISFTNYKFGNPDQMRVGPGKIFNVRAVDPDIPPPSVELITPDTFFEAFEALKDDKIRQTQKAAGLPSSLYSDNPGLAASGEALKIDWRELLESRNEDIVSLRNFDKELVKLTAIIADRDVASPNIGFAGGSYLFIISLNFKEIQTFESIEAKFERLETARVRGLITPLSYYYELTQDETVKTNQEAIDKMNENSALFEQLNFTAPEIETVVEDENGIDTNQFEGE